MAEVFGKGLPVLVGVLRMGTQWKWLKPREEMSIRRLSV